MPGMELLCSLEKSLIPDRSILWLHQRSRRYVYLSSTCLEVANLVTICCLRWTNHQLSFNEPSPPLWSGVMVVGHWHLLVRDGEMENMEIWRDGDMWSKRYKIFLRDCCWSRYCQKKKHQIVKKLQTAFVLATQPSFYPWLLKQYKTRVGSWRRNQTNKHTNRGYCTWLLFLVLDLYTTTTQLLVSHPQFIHKCLYSAQYICRNCYLFYFGVLHHVHMNAPATPIMCPQAFAQHRANFLQLIFFVSIICTTPAWSLLPHPQFLQNRPHSH